MHLAEVMCHKDEKKPQWQYRIIMTLTVARCCGVGKNTGISLSGRDDEY